MSSGQRSEAALSWSRGDLLKAALAGGAVVGGGAALGAGRRDAAPRAAAVARARDVEVLNLFLTLEQVQEAFYDKAIRAGALDGPLMAYARAVGAQEARHVAMLRGQLAGEARSRPASEAGDAVRSPEAFTAAAVELEEAVVAAYVGQGANLSDETIVPVTTLVSVEARQAGWIRDLAGISPAPRAADAAREPEAVLDELREKGLLR